MAEKSNEEALNLFEIALHDLWFNGGKYAGPDDVQQARAAVLARMRGPGEVVVPREPTEAQLVAGYSALNGAPVMPPLHPRHRARWVAVYEAMTARPNGGNDDQGK